MHRDVDSVCSTPFNSDVSVWHHLLAAAFKQQGHISSTNKDGPSFRLHQPSLMMQHVCFNCQEACTTSGGNEGLYFSIYAFEEQFFFFFFLFFNNLTGLDA